MYSLTLVSLFSSKIYLFNFQGTTWKCKRCLDSDSHRLKQSESKQRRDSLRSVSSSNTNEAQVAVISATKVLPYDVRSFKSMYSFVILHLFMFQLNTLNWDTYHRVNVEQIYCYCGGSGEWYKQMLQCGRCRQWFHEKCLDCLQYPLYCGDRYVIIGFFKMNLRIFNVLFFQILCICLFNL